MTPDELIRSYARSHYGVIDRATAVRYGLSDRQIRQRLRSGTWRRHTTSVFLLGGVPTSREQRLLAAAWGSGGVASHLGAAWLEDLVDDLERLADVTVGPNGVRNLAGARIHRSLTLTRRDCTTVRGIPTTAVERTLIDLADVVEPGDLRACVDRALRLKLTHPDRLIARFLSLDRPGRPGSGALREVLADLDADLRAVESDLESLLLKLVVDAGLPAPVPQHVVVLPDRTFRLDFAYPEAMLAIEADGFGVHGTRDAFESDRERQNDLMLAGWRILRFTWRQICNEPDWVVEQIRAALGPVLESARK